ncbi:MAG: DoxX family protein [Actinomycetota bacterium]|jgi:putative oxidoreductase|nr:DoxX family protein [Rubrobacter sp.]MDQ3509890.1 DoxX family protein [Actinomycetota bacterium]
MRDFAVLMVRLVVGGLLAGHGAQKLFGSFGGSGMEGFAGFLESLGMKPGKPWAALAGLSEFGGGTLTALGLLNPLGPLGILGAMCMAAFKAHGVKPIWAQEGGGELPVTNAAIAAAIALAGPGKYSLDHALGVRLPKRLVALAFISGLVVAAAGLASDPDDGGGEDDPESGSGG